MSDPEVDLDAQILLDIRGFAAVASSIVAYGEEAFFGEGDDAKILRYAARTVILNVSAAADHLSQRFKDARPEVPWRAVRGIRNRVAHDYDGVNEAIVWTALVKDVPGLLKALMRGQ